MWRLAAKSGRRAQLALGVFGVGMVLLYAAVASIMPCACHPTGCGSISWSITAPFTS